MTGFFGAIADDFTGATDLAGLLARSGLRVSLRIDVPDESEVAAPIEIIALKTRTVPADQAIEEALRALKWLQRAGAQRLFWKYCSTFDSTALGNIGPVAEALMRQLGATQTIYCPAFPENGRSVFMGNLFVGEQPLAESPMKDHPLTPMRDSNLLRLLEPQVTKPVGLANRLVVTQGAQSLRARLEQLREDGVAHVVVDAISNTDLQTIAEACRDMPLLTGGSAIAMSLPFFWASDGLVDLADAAMRQDVGDGPAIILSGSCSAMTLRQVAAYRMQPQPSYKLDPLDLITNGSEDAQRWLTGQDPEATPIIYASAAPDEVRAAQQQLGSERAGAMVEDALAACAIHARNLGYRRFLIAGGETSGAVTKALQVTRLDVGSEVAPGVPWCYTETAGHQIAIILKSGNFGAETFFADALRVLAA